MRKSFFLLLKLTLLFLIIAWIISSINIKEAAKVFLKTNLYYFLIAFLLSNLSHIIITIKWQRLSSPLKIKSSFLDLLALNYISVFYSIFVPGQGSGELIKGLKMTKKEGSSQKVWIPIFIDKITNLLIIFLIGLSAILLDKTFSKNTLLVILVSAFSIFLLMLIFILFSENTSRIVEVLKKYIANILGILKIKNNFIKDFSVTYIKEYKKHNFLLFETIFWSFLTKIPHIFAFYFFALSLNIKLNLIQSAWLFSIVSVASLLPVSFSGLGVREGTIVVLLSQIGVQNYMALSLSMLIFTTGIITGLIGGLIEVFKK